MKARVVMETCRTEGIRRRCRLLVPVRDRLGRTHYDERPMVLHEIFNLGRHMYLVRFEDGTTIYLFENEISFAQ